MTTAALPQTRDPVVQASQRFLQELLFQYGPRDFAVRFWDGTTWDSDPGQPARLTLVLHHPGTVRRMFWPANNISFGEAYIYDDFDVEGDFHALFKLINYLKALRLGFFRTLRLAKQLLWNLPSSKRPRTGRQAVQLSGALHSHERDQQAISYHYDVSNDFYALWLDSRMVYSCAYFATPDEDLDTAQERKLDYICRKLRLRPGQRLLDIGCGWGGLVLHAAQHYGVEVVGITLSTAQRGLAQERIQQAGLQNRCRVELRDYRDIDEPESFDKLVSVGMFEHVGEEMLPKYFEQAWRLLRPEGVFLNHGIALRNAQHRPKDAAFARRYVFPDGQVLPISTTLRYAEQSGFEVRDVESLREHYHHTLMHWVRRLEARADEARRATDEVAYRTWRLYMTGAADGFKSGSYNLYQTLLAKAEGGNAGLPLMRADWYA